MDGMERTSPQLEGRGGELTEARCWTGQCFALSGIVRADDQVFQLLELIDVSPETLFLS